MFDLALFIERKLLERYSVPGALPCMNGLSIEWRYTLCIHSCPKVRYKPRTTHPKCDVCDEHHFCIYLAWYFDVRRKYGRVPLLIRDKRVVLAVARVTGRVARVRSAAGSRVREPRVKLPSRSLARQPVPLACCESKQKRHSSVFSSNVKIPG